MPVVTVNGEKKKVAWYVQTFAYISSLCSHSRLDQHSPIVSACPYPPLRTQPPRVLADSKWTFVVPNHHFILTLVTVALVSEDTVLQNALIEIES